MGSNVLVFGDDPRSVVEVVYVPLYQGFGHLCGLGLVIVWAILFFSVMIDGVLIVGVFVSAFNYPISVCCLAHAILK